MVITLVILSLQIIQFIYAFPNFPRLNGCYEALEGGNTTEALIDFTGGVSEPLSLDREALSQLSDQRRALFQTLAKAHERKALITCFIRVMAVLFMSTVNTCMRSSTY